MQSLARSMRRFDQRIVDQWSWPVKIGVSVTTATTIAILYPPAEINFTQVSVFRLLSRPEQLLIAALLLTLLGISMRLPYWGGVACTLVICPLRMLAYTNTFNLAVYVVYGAIMYATVAAAVRQYRVSRWLVEERRRQNGDSSA